MLGSMLWMLKKAEFVITSSSSIYYGSSSLNTTYTWYKAIADAGFFSNEAEEWSLYMTGWFFLHGSLDSALEWSSCNSLKDSSSVCRRKTHLHFLQRKYISGICDEGFLMLPRECVTLPKLQENRDEWTAKGKCSFISVYSHSSASCWDLQQMYQLAPVGWLIFW